MAPRSGVETRTARRPAPGRPAMVAAARTPRRPRQSPATATTVLTNFLRRSPWRAPSRASILRGALDGAACLAWIPIVMTARPCSGVDAERLHQLSFAGRLMSSPPSRAALSVSIRNFNLARRSDPCGSRSIPRNGIAAPRPATPPASGLPPERAIPRRRLLRQRQHVEPDVLCRPGPTDPEASMTATRGWPSGVVE